MASTDNVIRLAAKVEHIPFTATPRATAMVKQLVLQHGPLAIHQSGGCCDGSLPLCLLADELGQGPNDLRLGDVEGVPFYIDAEQYQRWGEPEFLLDVVSGAPEGLLTRAARRAFRHPVAVRRGLSTPGRLSSQGPPGHARPGATKDPGDPEAGAHKGNELAASDQSTRRVRP